MTAPTHVILSRVGRKLGGVEGEGSGVVPPGCPGNDGSER
jgi:hypothetical protein